MKLKSQFAFAALLALFLTGCQSPRTGVGARQELFNGRDLAGWEYVSAVPKAPRDATWSVRKGVLICTGTPVGFLHTDQKFTNFQMIVEYRWAPGADPGNSGIFSRITDTRTAIPRCVEAQLMHGNAGDILTLQNMPMREDQDRFFEVKQHELAGHIRGVKKVKDAERPPGEWNRIEILADGPNYTVWLNGQIVNTATGVELTSGYVGLQSEGGEVHFRRATITPLP